MKHGMEDSRRVKRPRSDVKNAVNSYLQKRNFPNTSPKNIKKEEFIAETCVEGEIHRLNSVLYSCSTVDPAVIEQNYLKFINWYKECMKNKDCFDIEAMIGPLFCHLYLDMLQGEHVEKANQFFKTHLSTVDLTRCGEAVSHLISLIPNELDRDDSREKFRSNKYHIALLPESVRTLKEFIKKNCHVVFLQALQTWFHIDEKVEETESKLNPTQSSRSHKGHDKIRKLKKVIRDLKNEPRPIYTINIEKSKLEITSGVLKRKSGLFAFAENHIVRIRRVQSLDTIVEGSVGEIKLTGHSRKVIDMDFSPCNNYLATGSADTLVMIFQLADEKLVRVCEGHISAVGKIRISRNSEFVASGSEDGTARIWNLQSGQSLRVFAGHTQAITALDFHPNCLYLITGSADKSIRVWSIDNGSSLRLLHGSKGPVYEVKVSPNGQWLGSSSEDKRLKIWDLLSGKMATEFRGKDDPILHIAWSNDSRHICGATSGGVVKIWNVSKLKDPSNDMKHVEPSLVQNINSRVLNLEYAFGNFGLLTTKYGFD